MADNVQFSAFTQRELRRLAKTFTLMGDEAVEESRRIAFEVANLAQEEIKREGYQRTKSSGAIRRVVDGATISRTSKTGRLSYGFARQRFSGGATTQKLWGGLEFGSSIRKQFPPRSPRFGKGSRGYFIYPTLRQIQPELTARYLRAMNKVVSEWTK